LKLILSFFILVGSCANHRIPEQEKNNKIVASDSIASGRIKVEAIKNISRNEVCFEIKLKLSGTHQHQATPKNWTIAWVDGKNQYRLLSVNQRDPASIPEGGLLISKSGEREEWKNTFTTCGAKEELDEVKSIVLTPKELPFQYSRNLILSWEP
jgi:hypothetical protein